MMALEVKADPVSVARLFAAMEKRAALIHGGQKGIIEITAVKLVTALRAGTARSAAKRAIVPNPVYESEKMRARVFDKLSAGKARRRARELAYPFAVHFQYTRRPDGVPYQRGSAVEVPVFKKAEAGKSPLRVVEKRGLAKSSWAWMLKALHKDMATEQRFDPRLTGSSLQTFQQGAERVATWTGTNRVKYMRAAMTRPMASSIHAAATMMRKETERLVAKATAGAQAA